MLGLKLVHVIKLSPMQFNYRYQLGCVIAFSVGFPRHRFTDRWYSAQLSLIHDDVIIWRHFPRYWPFVRGIHWSRWIPRTKASDAEHWYFLWSAPEYRVEAGDLRRHSTNYDVIAIISYNSKSFDDPKSCVVIRNKMLFYWISIVLIT